MTTSYPKRLIEVDLPIKRISAHARREKSIRHGHISTLHIWWARRPLAACRAVILGALWPDPADVECPERFRKEVRERMLHWAWDNAAKASAESFERLVRIQKSARVLDDPLELRKCLLDFIADFANWDNSNDPAYLETSRALVQAAHEALGGEAGTRPLVVDPFAGGGAIPLEALRVGASAFASDLNPVAVLLNKVVLEYIPKFGQRLTDEVRKWGEWIKKAADKELAEFYPVDPDGATPVAYLWARTIQCEGPGCGAEVPLIRSLWLVKRTGRSVALRLTPEAKTRHVRVDVIEGAKRADVGGGTVRRGAASCPCCGYTTSADRVRAQFKKRRGGASDARLLAVIRVTEGSSGKTFRSAASGDVELVLQAGQRLASLGSSSGGLTALPDEALPYLRSIFNIQLLGVSSWGDLFGPRQALALTTHLRALAAVDATLGNTMNAEFREAVNTCAAISLDRLVDRASSLCRWDVTRESIANTFGRQALGIVWDYCEGNPTSAVTGGFEAGIGWVVKVCEQVAAGGLEPGHAVCAAAQEHPLPNDSASLFFTDPPYYDAVPYADLSDFFYVWLRRSLGKYHPTLLGEALSPKEAEIVQLSERNPIYAYKTRERFEDLMTRALSEGRRVTRPEDIGCVVFAHKATAAWEVQLAALIRGGWTVTASWPIDTEMSTRLRAQESAVLASSIHIVCRPRENTDGSLRTETVGDWRDVLAELPRRIHEWMPRLAEEGVVGADAIFACLGPALEVFSRYARVEKASGELVTLKEYLEYVWAAVAKEALSVIFAGAETSGFEADARLTAMWLWTLSAGSSGKAEPSGDEGELEEVDDAGKAGQSAKLAGFALEYDAARKIAQGLGAYLEDLASLVEVKGENARLLSVAERTRALFDKDHADAPTGGRKKQIQQMTLGFAEVLEEAEETGGLSQKGAPRAGQTVLDRVHQSMILFAAGRGEALRRFLVDEGVGRDARFWRLAQALAALYPTGTDERRWVEGVLARKKGLGF